ncbi:TPA: hypothetical protein VAH52_002988, partial [Legionella pneumophila]|nr:hypothetical protein [Legionella pneumophila]HEO1350900.1 hypothetical protein [Legionella pneumophila]HEO1409515.1 hypothetical protein [Legionella pneumophila]HEO1431182.1 hypothetical protein [Legionella pneumophila]
MKFFLKQSRQHSSNQKKRNQPAQSEDHHLIIRQAQFGTISIDFFGSLRFIFTFSLFCFRAIASLAISIVSGKELFDFIFNRTKIGLRSSIDTITVRRGVTNASQKIQETTQKKSLLEKESEEPSILTNKNPTIKPNTTHTQNAFFTKSEEKSKT